MTTLAVTRVGDPWMQWLNVHELGHHFAGLADEDPWVWSVSATDEALYFGGELAGVGGVDAAVARGPETGGYRHHHGGHRE
mgnify:CR=1 FL=1